MNTRLQLYLSGAPHYSRTIYRAGKRPVAVLDRTKRLQRLALRLKLRGMTEADVSRTLCRSQSLIKKLVSFGWRF